MKLLTQTLPVWQRIQLKASNFWFSLSHAEKYYVSAFISWLIISESLVLTCLLTLIGITSEFWPKFVKCWDSLAGKAIILLFYGTITNFALVTSAAYVNKVTTVPAVHFDYTHNFALLLMLPLWFIIVSFVALLIFQLIAPIYLLLLLTLRMFGISKMRLLSKSEHPILSNSLRFGLSILLLVQAVAWLNQNKEHVDELMLGTEQALSQSKIISQTTPSSVNKVATHTNESEPESEINISLDHDYEALILRAIAFFAYYFEADQFSRCKKLKESSVVELNDYEILEITRDQSTQYGYQFTVKKCISPAFPAAS